MRTNYSVWINRYLLVSSDKRIKKDIEVIPDNLSLEKLRNIECYYYNYIDEERNGEYKVIGFLAQQVKEHLPEAIKIQSGVIPDVNKFFNSFKITACDENGKELEPSVVGNVNKNVNIEGNTLFYINGEDWKCKCSLTDCLAYEKSVEHYYKLTILDDYTFEKNVSYEFHCYHLIDGDFKQDKITVRCMEDDEKSFVINNLR